MALIAGLGNPGPEYDKTRHNIGFELVDHLAAALSITLEPESGLYLSGEGRFKGQPVTLIKPLTFMNRSGRAITKALGGTGLTADDLLVCYDDIHLDVGAIRFRPGGSAGGHNGVNDIISQLGTKSFSRLRIGVGNNFGRGRQADYVLSPFTTDERIDMDLTLERAKDGVLTYLRAGIDIAMNEFN